MAEIQSGQSGSDTEPPAADEGAEPSKSNVPVAADAATQKENKPERKKDASGKDGGVIDG